MEDLTRLIAAHPFFSDLRAEYLALIVGCAANRRLNAGDSLFRERAVADEFYLLREGRVACECHVPGRGAVVFETVDAGEVLGWSWLVPPYTWHFDAFARTDARLITFDGSCLRNKMEADAALGYDLMKRFMPVIVKRLHATRMSLMDVYARPASSVVGTRPR